MILVVESGSTKTDWRWVASAQDSHAWKTVGINPFYQTASSLRDLFLADVLPHVPKTPEAVYYYGTGITGPEQQQVISDLFKVLWPSLEEIQVESDVLGAARALFGDEKGLAAILGTGSNSVWYEHGKIAFQVPPLGFWLGDEGSGGHLGKSLVLSYLHHEMPVTVREMFEAELGAFDRMPILEAAYRKPFPNRYFAQYTPFIKAHITEPFLENLANQSFTLFFEKYLQKYPEKSPLGFVGSVAHYFQETLKSVAKTQGFDIQQILATPLDALVDYHVNKR